jgi:NTE family protein
VSSVGLVLGGGGVTGAAFHFGTLFALEMATGWDPADADVLIGTSCGAVVGSILRSRALTLEALVGDAEGREEMAHSLGKRLYQRRRPKGVGRWIRHGVLPGILNPGLQFAVGCPAPYCTEGIAEWIREHIGEDADGWPEEPTIVVAYEVEGRRRVAFGTDEAPDTDIATAAAASSAVPLIFDPVTIGEKRYVDGGVASGTSADLLLAADEPLDLIIVIAPMASVEARQGARFYEGVLDRLGGTALSAELDAIHEAWPDTDVVVLRPDSGVLEEARPNPMSTAAAIPAFLRTLRSMRTELARPGVWSILERHLLVKGHR